MIQRVGSDEPSVLIEDSDEVADYLDACPVLFAAAGQDYDPLAPDAGRVVPIGIASDGRFAWPLSVSYMARTHQVAPKAELLEAIRARHYEAPILDEVDVSHLREQYRLESASADEALADLPPPGGTEDGNDVWG